MVRNNVKANSVTPDSSGKPFHNVESSDKRNPDVVIKQLLKLSTSGTIRAHKRLRACEFVRVLSKKWIVSACNMKKSSQVWIVATESYHMAKRILL